VDVTTFRKRSLDFREVDADVVSGMLTAAALELDGAVWGNLLDEGIFWLTQHKLSQTLTGMAARQDEDGPSSYWTEFERLQTQVACGQFLVAGGSL
jgi:hypothetical protein